MRTPTTAVLFAIVILLGVAIWWMDRDSAGGGGGDGGGNGNVLIQIDPEKIGRIAVKHPGGETILEKREGYWFLVEPVADRADPGAVSALVDLLGHLTILDRITREDVGSSEELSPEALGLTGDQVIRIELSGEDGEEAEHALLIGRPSPLENTVYARIPDSGDRPDIYAVDGNPRAYLENPVAALRDPHLLRLPIDRIVQIVVKTARGDIDIRRKLTPPVSDWALFRPLQTRADRNLLERLLTGFSALRFESVEDSNDLPGPAPNPVPDGSVALDFFRLGSDQPLTVFLQPKGGGADGNATELPLLEARVSDRPAVFQVRSGLLDLLPESPSEYRDKLLARIPPRLVFGIGIQSRGNQDVRLRKTPEGRWFSLRDGEEEPANHTRIARLIEAVNQTEVIEFVSDSAARLEDFGLSEPAQKVAFSMYEILPETAPDGAAAAGGGKVGVSKKVLQLGRPDLVDSEENVLYANFSGEPYIYRINPVFLQHLFRDPIEWKALKILNFNAINLLGFDRIQPGKPKLSLKYDYTRAGQDAWKVTRGTDENVSGSIDSAAAGRLRDALGSLTAIDWTRSLEAIRSLQNPSLVFNIRTREIDRATGQQQEVEKVLKIAAGTGIYYGALDNSAELFQIDRDTFTALIAPLILEKITPPVR